MESQSHGLSAVISHNLPQHELFCVRFLFWKPCSMFYVRFQCTCPFPFVSSCSGARPTPSWRLCAAREHIEWRLHVESAWQQVGCTVLHLYIQHAFFNFCKNHFSGLKCYVWRINCELLTSKIIIVRTFNWHVCYQMSGELIVRRYILFCSKIHWWAIHNK